MVQVKTNLSTLLCGLFLNSIFILPVFGASMRRRLHGQRNHIACNNLPASALDPFKVESGTFKIFVVWTGTDCTGEYAGHYEVCHVETLATNQCTNPYSFPFATYNLNVHFGFEGTWDGSTQTDSQSGFKGSRNVQYLSGGYYTNGNDCSHGVSANNKYSLTGLNVEYLGIEQSEHTGKYSCTIEQVGI